MSVFLNINSKVDKCPHCGHLSPIPLEIVDKDFATRNHLDQDVRDMIAEDGLFELQACPICGLKWCENMAVATSAQLYMAITEYVHKELYDCTSEELGDFIQEFSFVMPEIMNLRDTGQCSPFDVVVAVGQFLKTCPLEDLVEVYNHFASPMDQVEKCAVTPDLVLVDD